MEERFKVVVNERRSLDLIIEEIRLTCVNHGVQCTESMAKYALSIISLDPALAEIPRGSPKMILHVTQKAVNYLITMKGVRHRLLMAQSYYFEEFRSVEHIISHYRRMLNLQVHPLLQHLMVYERAEPDTEMIFRQIVFLTMLTTGMGDATNPMTFKEAEAAVRSVFPSKDVARFITLAQSRKRKELQEIIRIATGVRMYNKARAIPTSLGSCGTDEISELPALLFRATITMEERVKESLQRVTRQVTNLEHALEECFVWDPKSVGVLNFNSYISDDELDAAKDVLCLHQQVLQVLRFMLKSLSDTVQLHLKTEAAVRFRVSQMMAKMDCKVGIPKAEVSDDFVELFYHWKFFQGRFVLISEFNRMLKKYNEICEVPFLPEPIVWVLNTLECFVPSEEESDLSMESSSNFDVKWVEEDGREVEFAGFDPVWLTLTSGILLSGNKSMGLLKFNEKCYAFRDHEAAKMFFHSPHECIGRVYDFGRRNPEFIDILHIREGLRANSGESYGMQTRFHRSKGVQTEVHPIPTRLNYKYQHSTWSMKKDACRAMDLMNRKTSAMQTRLSHMKRSAETQTFRAVEKESLTSKSEGTSVPKLQNFIFGLRGRREKDQHTVTLTRPLEEGIKEILNETRPCDTLFGDGENPTAGVCRPECVCNDSCESKPLPCAYFGNKNLECVSFERDVKHSSW